MLFHLIYQRNFFYSFFFIFKNISSSYAFTNGVPASAITNSGSPWPTWHKTSTLNVDLYSCTECHWGCTCDLHLYWGICKQRVAATLLQNEIILTCSFKSNVCKKGGPYFVLCSGFVVVETFIKYKSKKHSKNRYRTILFYFSNSHY